MSWREYGGQRTTRWSGFCHSTMWDLETELRPSGFDRFHIYLLRQLTGPVCGSFPCPPQMSIFDQRLRVNVSQPLLDCPISFHFYSAWCLCPQFQLCSLCTVCALSGLRHTLCCLTPRFLCRGLEMILAVSGDLPYLFPRSRNRCSPFSVARCLRTVFL